MKLSVLHISDLHRDPANPIRNDVLLESLENDRRRYAVEETPMARPPDLVIVSGDIIQGITPDARDPEKALRSQYQEALDYLGQLTDRFVGGDRNRVIVVPGNHDVSAYHFEKSLRRVDILPDRKKGLVTQLFSPGSPLRWSWSGFELYEIADQQLYEQRLGAFAEFYATFYGGARTYDIAPERQLDLFDFPGLDVTVVGFSSCHNNDLFNKQGAIHPSCIADAGMRLRHSSLNNRLRIAVWHHNAEGLPAHSDYMDPDLVQNLIDRGFSLGFHGHQHRPQFLETRFRHGTNRTITVISAGTLCGSASVRHGRSYNIVELDTETREGRLHVREMQNDNLSLPIWGRRALPPNTKTYCDFKFEPPPAPAVHRNENTAALIDAQRLYDLGDYREAADALAPLAALDDLARPLLLDSLLRLKDMPALIASFDPPTSVAEAIHVIDALWAEGRRDRLGEVLLLPLVVEATDLSVIEMRQKYSMRLTR
ncbi:MAG: metallophosphoesterase [Acidobacteria bacterium]|nr:metallophosphoesterase [Acidobacteriota bacterium]